MPDTMARKIARAVLALAYLAVGIVHLKSPEGFLPIMPDWVPFPREVVLATGIAEIAGAIGLMAPSVGAIAAILRPSRNRGCWPVALRTTTSAS